MYFTIPLSCKISSSHCVQDFTCDLAVVSICLHYVAWVTVTSVGARSVDAQLTAHT